MTNGVLPMDLLISLRDTLLKALPRAKKAYLERIENVDLPLISIEVVSSSWEAVDKYRMRQTLTVDIVYISAGNSVAEALDASARTMRILSQGLPVKDRYIHCSTFPTTTLVDQDAHTLVSYSWLEDSTPVVLSEDGNLVELIPDGGTLDAILDEKHVETEPVIDSDTGEPKTDPETGEPITKPVLDEDGVTRTLPHEAMQTLYITFDE